MDKFISWFFSNKENITFIIAVAGFALSLYSVITLHFQNRESYKIEIVDYHKAFGRVVSLYVCITNRSAAPLLIKSISLNGVACELLPKAIHNRPQDWNFRSTPMFPICIAGRHCRYAFIEFVSSELSKVQLQSGSKLSLDVCTSKKKRTKTIHLGAVSHYLNPPVR